MVPVASAAELQNHRTYPLAFHPLCFFFFFFRFGFMSLTDPVLQLQLNKVLGKRTDNGLMVSKAHIGMNVTYF